MCATPEKVVKNRYFSLWKVSLGNKRINKGLLLGPLGIGGLARLAISLGEEHELMVIAKRFRLSVIFV